MEKFTVQGELEHSSQLLGLHSLLGARIRLREEQARFQNLGSEPRQVDTDCGAVLVAVAAVGGSLAPWGTECRGEPLDPHSWRAWVVLQLP